MTDTIDDVLRAFDSFPTAEQHRLAVEILRRWTTTEDLSEAALDELAADLFRAYDAEEAARASAP